MAKPWYVIVFNEDRAIGLDPDPRQHWFKGQVYSQGSSIDRDDLARKSYLSIIELPSRPHPDEVWDPVKQQFVDVTDI